MVHVLAFVEVKEGRVDEFMEFFNQIVHDVHNEKGCIEYMPTIDLNVNDEAQEFNANLVTVIEKWETQADLKAHSIASHMIEFQKNVAHLVEKVTLKVLQEL